MKAADAIVVGGGIVGAACAEALTAEGLSVRLLEREHPGCGTTSAGMGHILVLDDSEAQLALTKWSRDLWARRFGDWPAAVEWNACGAIWVAEDEAQMARVRQKAVRFAERGVRAEVLDPAQLRDAEPTLRVGLAGGLLLSDDAVVYPPAATTHLLDRARARGAVVELRTSVRAAGDGFVLTEDGTRLEAGVVVVAAGLATPALLDAPLPHLRVRPKKGHLAITRRVPGFLRHQLIEVGYLDSAHGTGRSSVAFNVQPRATGQLLIGSSRQLDNEDPAVELPMVAHMCGRACAFLPALVDLPVIRTWVGFRPSTDHNLPVIGPVPERPRLLIATGHEGIGITTSLATGRLIVDHVVGNSSLIDPEPYLPQRVASDAHG